MQELFDIVFVLTCLNSMFQVAPGGVVIVAVIVASGAVTHPGTRPVMTVALGMTGGAHPHRHAGTKAGGGEVSSPHLTWNCLLYLVYCFTLQQIMNCYID